MRRTVPIGRSLLVNLIAVITLLIAAILATTIFAARTAVRTLSAAVIRGTLDQTELRLTRFFDPVRRGLLEARAWGESGLLTIDDPDAFTELCMPIVEQRGQVSSLMLARGDGREIMLLRLADGWFSRVTNLDDHESPFRFRRWTTGMPPLRRLDEPLDYDPRRRPWYRAAVDGGVEIPRGLGAEAVVHWTEPYTFFTTKEPGITASLAYDAGDGLEHVLAFDVLLADISKFTTSLDVSEHGMVFVLTEDRRFVGLPGRRGLGAEALLERPQDLRIPLVVDATNALTAVAGGTTRFRSDGAWWWGEARLHALAPDRKLIVAVIVPESDVLGSLVGLRYWIIGITLAALAIAIVQAVRLARRYSRPLQALVRQSDRIRRGDLETAGAVTSRVREVHQLAEAQDRMRVGLQSLMKLERDIQLARQIQQKTFPSRLPDVDGFDIAAWSEPADETGGDSYDVIGYRVGDGATVLAMEDVDRVVLLLADATGHGIGPALSVTQVRSMLRMAVRMGKGIVEIAHSMNEELCLDLPEGRFITAWLGELNRREGTLTTFSAGQAPILYYHAGEDRREVRSADTLPLGIMPGLDVDEPRPLPMRRGDVLAVLSDGIFEAAGAEGELFGTNRVFDVITAHRRERCDAILERLRTAVDQFTGGRPPADDRTAVMVRRL